jgi:acetate kinase
LYFIWSIRWDILEDVNNLLLKESGMLGLTGFSDLREIELQAEEGMHRVN